MYASYLKIFSLPQKATRDHLVKVSKQTLYCMQMRQRELASPCLANLWFHKFVYPAKETLKETGVEIG